MRESFRRREHLGAVENQFARSQRIDSAHGQGMRPVCPHPPPVIPANVGTQLRRYCGSQCDRAAPPLQHDASITPAVTASSATSGPSASRYCLLPTSPTSRSGKICPPQRIAVRHKAVAQGLKLPVRQGMWPSFAALCGEDARGRAIDGGVCPRHGFGPRPQRASGLGWAARIRAMSVRISG